MSPNLAQPKSGVNLEQFLMYGAYLHIYMSQCMEVRGSTLTLNARYTSNNSSKHIEMGMYLKAWLFRIIQTMLFHREVNIRHP